MLTAQLVLDPSAAMIVGAIVDVPASAPHLPVLYMIPSTAGLAALRADPGLAAGKRIGLAHVDALRIGAAARLAPIARGKSLKDIAEYMHQCGPLCPLYFGFGNGLMLVSLASPDEITRGIRKRIEEAPQLASARFSLTGSILVVEPFGEIGKSLADRARSVKLAPTPPPTEPEACYSRAMIAARSTLHALSRAPGQGASLDHLATAQQADLDCAARDPRLTVRVAKLREALASLRKAATP